MKHPHIPRTWTGREALAIVEALEAAVDAIFDVYRADIRVELLAREMQRDALAPTPVPVLSQPAELDPF